MRADCMEASEAPEKKCGTCRWFEKLEWYATTGRCQYPIAKMPLSVIKSLGGPREDRDFDLNNLKHFVYESDTNCPTWEEKA